MWRGFIFGLAHSHSSPDATHMAHSHSYLMEALADFAKKGKGLHYGVWRDVLRSSQTPHRLAASGRSPSSLVGPKSSITNSKKSEKNVKHSCDVILCDLVAGKKFKPRMRKFFRKSLPRNNIPRSRLYDF
jgi:hypothetical protein